MKAKILNALLIVTSLLGYLEWGGGNNILLFQGEADIILKLFTNPKSVAHPFILMPLLGQLLLLLTIFQKTPNRILTFIGIGSLGLLLGFMFIIGIISMNFKILLSTIPFLITAIYTVFYLRKNKK